MAIADASMAKMAQRRMVFQPGGKHHGGSGSLTAAAGRTPWPCTEPVKGVKLDELRRRVHYLQGAFKDASADSNWMRGAWVDWGRYSMVAAPVLQRAALCSSGRRLKEPVVIRLSWVDSVGLQRVSRAITPTGASLSAAYPAIHNSCLRRYYLPIRLSIAIEAQTASAHSGCSRSAA